MIPRFKPAVGLSECTAALHPQAGAVERFEREFASTFGAREGIAFSYGRSALWALFKALGIEGGEIIVPAYTCVVAPHAIVLSGNRCRFVEATAADFNMDLDQVAAAIGPETRAIVATHLFGYPLDCDRLAQVVADGERRIGRKILVVHDCAHSFGATWKGRLVTAEHDVALFGLGISKLMTSIFGGMLTTDDAEIASKVRAFREKHYRPSTARKGVERALYLVASRTAFSAAAYPAVHWLEHETTLLDTLTKAYHLDDIIHFPPDHLDRMGDVEASVGLVQLKKYAEIVAAHVDNAKFYDSRLRGRVPWTLPPIVDGATYSHYVLRVPDRQALLRAALRQGVELGHLIQYSVPHMIRYGSAAPDVFPYSRAFSDQAVNLPVYHGLTDIERERVVSALLTQAGGHAAAA